MLLPGMAFLDSGCCLRQYWSGLAENLIQTEFLLNAEKRQVGGDTHTHTQSQTPADHHGWWCVPQVGNGEEHKDGYVLTARRLFRR